MAYVRVSTIDQVEFGAGLKAPRAAIRLACDMRDWRLLDLFEDPEFSGKNLERPGLSSAIEAVESGRASG